MKLNIQKLMTHPVVNGIRTKIRKGYYPQFDWTNGGCFALAEALVKALPGAELWAVASKEEEDWASEHAVVKYDGRFYDGKGEQTEALLLANYGNSKRKTRLGKVKDWVDRDPPNALWYPDQEFVTRREISTITRLARELFIQGSGLPKAVERNLL